MSVNWVMFAPGAADFVRLPGESVLFTTPARVAFALQSLNKFPGKQPYYLSCPGGKAWLTNKRLIYLPTVQPSSTSSNPSPLVLHSFSAPHARIHDSHVTAPWFGPNTWECIINPVPGGGIPSSSDGVSLTLTFKEGGAYDFHARICEIKERLAQMREMYGVAEEVGQGGAGGEGMHLDQLPAYEEVGESLPVPAAVQQTQASTSNGAAGVGQTIPVPQSTNAQVLPQPTGNASPPTRRPQGQPQQQAAVPDEPPPGYDEISGTAH